MIAFATRTLTALLVAAGLFAGVPVAAADPPARPFELWEPNLVAAPKWDFRWKPATPAAGIDFDWSKYPEERKKLAGEKGFPRLGWDYEVLAPSTGHPDQPETLRPGVKTYNCIAWSLGVSDRWVWPGESVKAFDELYARRGYKRLAARDFALEPGVEKVVLFGTLKDVKLTGADGKVREEVLVAATHAARQEADGGWTSKLGGLARIRHRTPDAVAGGTYGEPVAVYAREKRSAGALPAVKR